MYPRNNRLKEQLAQGKAIHGMFIQTGSEELLEIAGLVGYDFVVIDCEHGSIDLASAIRLIRAAEAVQVTPLVRVPNHDATFIGKVIEAGAMGVYVPDVSTAEQMRAIVAAVKYKEGDNGGGRGACPGIRAAGHQSDDWGRFFRWSNANTVVVPLIETVEGIANFDEILQVPGIDWVGIGTFDLSHALGHEGSRDRPELDRIYDDITGKLRRAGITFSRYPMPLKQPFDPGDPTQSPEHFRQDKHKWMKLGARVFMMGSDRGLCKQAFYQRLAPMLD